MPAPYVNGLPFSDAVAIARKPHYLNGLTPALKWQDATIPPLNEKIEAHSMVSIDAMGQVKTLEAADYGQTVGMILSTVDTTGDFEIRTISVLTGGCLNPEGVIWGADFPTLEDKLAVIRNAKNSNDIVLQPTL